MERVDFIPLGSVVFLKGGTQKVMIIARAITAERGGKTFYFDYGGVLYPQGLVGAQMAYFNNDDIRAIAFIGCNDEDNQVILDAINDGLEKRTDLVRGSVDEWQAAGAQEG